MAESGLCWYYFGVFRITRETDYGLLVLAQMARHAGDQPHAARQIAEWADLSAPMTSKILKGLARNDLVVSNRGAKGGYALSRPLESISIADVIEVFEGPIGLVDCLAHPGQCEQEPTCTTSGNWKRVNHVVFEALSRIPVSEMVCSEGETPALLKLEGTSIEESTA